nr:hypothetical protein BaRGS_015463 [Batillaria attramentaria]
MALKEKIVQIYEAFFQDNFNLLFFRATECLKQENPIRIVNALKTLIECLNGFLTGEHPTSLKLLTLKFLLVLITILGHPTQRQVLGHDAALVLTLLVQYRKYEDQYANSLMHDANMTFRVPLHRMVLEVVRGNYDTLTLKLQDSLDQFERYLGKAEGGALPSQICLLNVLQVRSIICDVRKGVSNLSAQHQELLQELATIS